MATQTRRAIKQIEDTRDDVADTLLASLTSLRKEIATLAESVNDYGGNRLSDLQHGATALAREVQQQLPAVAKQASRQAGIAARAVRNDPLPTIVMLGTIALVSALVFRRD
jgi:ElaB/YqjD/DUF883 family membrane-anchored ribosome-binding protein